MTPLFFKHGGFPILCSCTSFLTMYGRTRIVSCLGQDDDEEWTSRIGMGYHVKCENSTVDGIALRKVNT
jgi:hypothetical protein